MVTDNARNENKAVAIKKLAGKMHFGLQTTEAYMQNQNKVERVIGSLKEKKKQLMEVLKVPPVYTSYVYKWFAHLHNLSANSLLYNRNPGEAMTGETGDLSHLRFAFWTPIWYAPVDSDENSEVTMIKGRYLGPATSTGNDITDHILPVVVDKKGNEVARSFTDIPQKGKSEKRRPDVIQRSYVTVRHPDEHAFKGIMQDNRRSWLYPRKLFPSRTKRDGTPWNIMLQEARALGKPEGPELVKRAHERRHIPDSLINQGDGQKITQSNNSEHANQPCMYDEELTIKAREMHEELTCERLAQTLDNTSLYTMRLPRPYFLTRESHLLLVLKA